MNYFFHYIRFIFLLDMIVSGSWDCTIRLWDIRKKDALFGQYEIGDGAKVFALSLVHHKLVVATAGRQFFIYDIRNMSETIQKRESSLKFMTRCVKCMPNRQGKYLLKIKHSFKYI